MKITFEKRPGNSSREIAFFWKMTITAKSPAVITDHFIPELFFDFFLIKEGKVRCTDETQGVEFRLPGQVFKAIHSHPLRLDYFLPLVLYGTRLSLGFAESFWGGNMQANRFLTQKWVSQQADDLDSFAMQVTGYLQDRQVRKYPYPMLSTALQESGWLVHFSPRHKRRLYKAAFGLNRKELQSIRNVHTFLEQTCDFGSENPRIIRYIDPEVFYDQPHLNRAFKKMTGFSPVEYFQANSILQDNLMSASSNAIPAL